MRRFLHWGAFIVAAVCLGGAALVIVGGLVWLVRDLAEQFSDWWLIAAWAGFWVFVYACAQYLDNHGLPWKRAPDPPQAVTALPPVYFLPGEDWHGGVSTDGERICWVCDKPAAVKKNHVWLCRWHGRVGR